MGRRRKEIITYPTSDFDIEITSDNYDESDNSVDNGQEEVNFITVDQQRYTICFIDSMCNMNKIGLSTLLNIPLKEINAWFVLRSYQFFRRWYNAQIRVFKKQSEDLMFGKLLHAALLDNVNPTTKLRAIDIYLKARGYSTLKITHEETRKRIDIQKRIAQCDIIEHDDIFDEGKDINNIEEV